MEDEPATIEQFKQLTGLEIRFQGASDEKAKDLPPAPTANGAANIKPENDRRGFALVIETGPSEFVIAASGVTIKKGAAQIGSVDEVLFNHNQMVAGRPLNGDEQYFANTFASSPGKIEVHKVITYTPR